VLRTAAALSAALLLVDPVAANPVPADELSLLNGADHFARHCTRCHGWNPSEQYDSLYGDDPIAGPDPLLDIAEEAPQDDPDLLPEAIEEDVDDWPEWAGPPPEEEIDYEDERQTILNDLNSAIDAHYADESEPWGYEVYREERVDTGGDELPSIAEVFGEDADGDGLRAPGATDLTDPDSFVYGTSETDLFANIANGTGPSMPGFLGELGGEDAVWDLVNYIRSLWGEDWID